MHRRRTATRLTRTPRRTSRPAAARAASPARPGSRPRTRRPRTSRPPWQRPRPSRPTRRTRTCPSGFSARGTVGTSRRRTRSIRMRTPPTRTTQTRTRRRGSRPVAVTVAASRLDRHPDVRPGCEERAGGAGGFEGGAERCLEHERVDPRAEPWQRRKRPAVQHRRQRREGEQPELRRPGRDADAVRRVRLGHGHPGLRPGRQERAGRAGSVDREAGQSQQHQHADPGAEPGQRRQRRAEQLGRLRRECEELERRGSDGESNPARWQLV